MVDGVKALSGISGLSKQEVLKIWQEVKANHARLASCRRHEFIETKVKIGDKLTCFHCQGTMSLADVGWYTKGYVAAGGNSDDIWKAWKETRRGSV